MEVETIKNIFLKRSPPAPKFQIKWSDLGTTFEAPEEKVTAKKGSKVVLVCMHFKFVLGMLAAVDSLLAVPGRSLFLAVLVSWGTPENDTIFVYLCFSLFFICSAVYLFLNRR